MKKSSKIILISCIVFLFAVSSFLTGYMIKLLVNRIQVLNTLSAEVDFLLNNPADANEETTIYYLEQANFVRKSIGLYVIYIFLGFLSIAACTFIFIYCNPRLFRRSTWTNLSEEWAQAKSERLARKQEKAEADKQKRLEELQAEIEKLKKE